MEIGKSIYKLRTGANLSQEQFAALFGVSQQSVQKWENGDSVPELTKILLMAGHFGVSLDAFILGNSNRVVEEMKNTASLAPQYVNLHDWEFYGSDLMVEYEQCLDEGLDLAGYQPLFLAASALPKGEIKKELADLLFRVVSTASLREGYAYQEPNDWEGIQALCLPHSYEKRGRLPLKEKVYGAWMGRLCGCLLGKPLEGIQTHELTAFLKETGNFPMHRYLVEEDVTRERVAGYSFPFAGRFFGDTSHGMPADDDTNYTVLYQQLIRKYGRDFTSFDISRLWLSSQPKDAYCTAERVAFCNFIKGYAPPQSAVFQNPYREWIGAQIRGDYFGYINPGDPKTAAHMAWRDGRISHVKNGIYGEMLVAAMIAVAAETDNMEDILEGGLAQIPHTSRLHRELTEDLEGYRKGRSFEDCLAGIYTRYDQKNPHHWCHTVSNARIVAAALLYGRGDFAKSVCMAVQAGFDTDCNGATVGSIVGMAKGIGAIPRAFQGPIADTLHTMVFGVGTVSVSSRADLTMKHIEKTSL